MDCFEQQILAFQPGRNSYEERTEQNVLMTLAMTDSGVLGLNRRNKNLLRTKGK